MAKILVVDDNQQLVSIVTSGLRQEGYDVRQAYNGIDALKALQTERPGLIILDVCMPEMNGIEFCSRIRSQPESADIPIIFLTAKGKLEDKISGFNAGADDYLVKPFEFTELLLRVRVLLRRAQRPVRHEHAARLQIRDLTLDQDSYQVQVGNRKVALTPVEFELLRYLMRNPGKVLSTDDLLQGVWGYPPGAGNPSLVRKHIKNLRDKLDTRPDAPGYVRTISRRGYLLE